MSDVQARIAEDVKNNPVLLYMKGTPAFPQCGFSSVAVQILTHLGAKFETRDVLADPEVVKAVNAAGYDAMPSSAEELQALMKREYETWGRIVKATKIEKE